MVSSVGNVAGHGISPISNPTMKTYEAPVILENLYWRHDKKNIWETAWKNDFAKVSKNLAKSENNYVRPSK